MFCWAFTFFFFKKENDEPPNRRFSFETDKARLFIILCDSPIQWDETSSCSRSIHSHYTVDREVYLKMKKKVCSLVSLLDKGANYHSVLSQEKIWKTFSIPHLKKFIQPSNILLLKVYMSKIYEFKFFKN